MTSILSTELILQEYKEYLTQKELSRATQYQYTYELKQYIQKHNIQTKEELRNTLQKETQKPPYSTQVYKWLNITPPLRRHKKHPKKYKVKEKEHVTYEPIYDETVQRFFKERGLRESTHQGYLGSLKLYIPQSGFRCADEMIHEALEDERKHIPIKEARITQHLRDYKAFLQDYPRIRTRHSIHTYFTKIETFYRHFQVTVPPRPPMSIKSDYHVTYYDLPDKHMIETAITQSELQLQAIIYFMSSSGTAKAETLSITVQKFIDSLRDYTKTSNPKQVVQELQGRKDLVPVIGLTRKKTSVPYYTCCSSEATYYILEYMKANKRYNPEQYLWTLSSSALLKRFQILNDNNHWGKIGPYRRFRAHALRKYHASNLGCSFDVINTLEGRTNGTIHETYVKQKPEALKEVYMEHMHNVMIHPELFEGPHCGGESEKEQIKNSIKELVPDLVPTLERVTEVQQQQVQPVEQAHAPVLQQAPWDYSIIKDIAKLEARMDAIEKRLERIGGEYNG